MGRAGRQNRRHHEPESEPPESQLPLSDPPESQLPLSDPESQLPESEPESELLQSQPPESDELSLVSHQLLLLEELSELLLDELDECPLPTLHWVNMTRPMSSKITPRFIQNRY